MQFAEVRETQLYLFSNTSRPGYTAVVCLRMPYQVHCPLLMGKARLVPFSEIQIPILELTAAVISVKLSKIVREELDMKFHRVYYWTDSTSVLKCINNESKRFYTFESNHSTVIHSGSLTSEWNYVNRDVNLADDG